MVPGDDEKWLEKDYEEVGIEIAEADEDGCDYEECHFKIIFFNKHFILLNKYSMMNDIL